MKYLCLGYYEPAKHAAMTEDERNAMFDECFEYDDYLRANLVSIDPMALSCHFAE